jgi:hypothetical protein
LTPEGTDPEVLAQMDSARAKAVLESQAAMTAAKDTSNEIEDVRRHCASRMEYLRLQCEEKLSACEATAHIK